jgi:hypothetical protein
MIVKHRPGDGVFHTPSQSNDISYYKCYSTSDAPPESLHKTTTSSFGGQQMNTITKPINVKVVSHQNCQHFFENPMPIAVRPTPWEAGET